MRLGPGRWLNAQMQLLSWLGEELHGESFLAEQRPQGRSVVVKILHAEACRTPAYIERFRHIAERTMLLSHRHLAAVHAFGVLQSGSEGERGVSSGTGQELGLRTLSTSAQGIPWIATDPLEGPDLRSYLTDGIAPETLLSLLTPLADALDQAAALGLCHGELLPQNLILIEEPEQPPRLVLIDLGVAKVLAADLLELPMPPGSLSYRSPEQCRDGREVSAASDRYGLATLLFEAVAGRPPFVASDPQKLMQLHLSAPIPPLRTLSPRLRNAEALDTFFVRALAKQPEARFPSAMAMLEEFHEAISPRPKRPIREGERRRSPRFYRLSRQGQSDKVLDVIVGPRAVLGKQSECDMVCQALPSPEFDSLTAAISREHAVLIWLDNRLSVLDQSSNGTFVNDKRVGPRLTQLPDGAMVRLGEHLVVQVHLLHSGSRPGAPPVGEGCDAIGCLLIRRDPFAIGAPTTLMLWSHLDLHGSPLARLGGALRLGQAWVSQRELWWSGHPTVVWQRHDQSMVLGPAPLRHGDILKNSDAVICVEH
jgi:serine/threonine protein kinase